MHKLNLNLNLHNSRGQAFVEYLLLVVVGVSLVSIIAYRLFTPLQAWARNYMGAYIECLLDAGELPRMGGETGESECDEGFEPFTVAEGRPSRSGGSSLNLSGGSSGMPPYNPSGSQSSGRTNLSAEGGASGRGGADGPQRRENREQILNSPAFSGASTSRNSATSPSLPPRSVTLSQEELSEAERRRLPRRTSKNTDMGLAEGVPSARKALVIPPRERKPTSVDDEIEPFSFGRIFRIAFIVAVLGILFLLILLQARQIQKSLEKRNN